MSENSQGIKLACKQWVCDQIKCEDFTCFPLPAEASFRSYYRIKSQGNRYILMVAPPDEEMSAFVKIANHWGQQGIKVPKILAWESRQGFLLLSDLGTRLFYDSVEKGNAKALYQQAMQTIVSIQRLMPALPLFDEAFIYRELGYFKEWFLGELLSISYSAHKALLDPVFAYLAECCLLQPQVTVHRDFHSRNLVVMEQGPLGILDFQDAVIGPITYDLVSLLKDCYINWPSDWVRAWASSFYTMAKGIEVSLPLFLKWFDGVGLQRHLKVLGIFARLKLRDKKPSYVLHIPRIMAYVLEVASHDPALHAFHHWLQKVVLPALQRWQQSEKRVS